MTKSRNAFETLPPLYAVVQPGLEPVAADEVTRDFGGDVKRTGAGIVVFRLPRIDKSVLELRTTEDVFLLGWGTDRLTYRAEDLERITRWTAHDVKWDQLLRIHHSIRPKPKGKPTYRIVSQMTGTHGYRRIDAGKALARGLEGKLPASWRHADENAALEVWLTINGTTGYCGLRLSDRTMRHRTYKHEHVAASLRPTVAASMVRLADVKPHHVVVDPMCGAGTILAECLAATRTDSAQITLMGGDIDSAAIRAATANLPRAGQVSLSCWDATHLPLGDNAVDRIISNPPFGKQLGRPQDIERLYRRMIAEYDRVLNPGGAAVLLVAEFNPLREAARSVGWQPQQKLRVRVLGQNAVLSVWRKDK